MDLDQPNIEHTWTERGLRPVISLYVALVFAVFMGLAHFVFHSPEALKALLLTGVGSLVATAPASLRRIEYRFTENGLEKRPYREDEPKPFEPVFTWGRTTHLAPTKSGFKYFSLLDEPNPILRFMKLHFLSDYSGEFHVGPEDQAQVEAIIDRHGIPRTHVPRALRSGG